MRIFISWSGERSRHIANALKTWLPYIFQDLVPWMSDHDIGAGVRWNTDLDSVLESTNFGILCLTPENLSAPWLLFEAGALAKTVKEARVVPYLFELTPANVEPPLSQFQGVPADRAGTCKLLQSINSFRASTLAPDRLNRFFDKFWPDLHVQLQNVPAYTGVSAPMRPERELLEEILQLVRRLEPRQSTVDYEVAGLSTEALLEWLRTSTNNQMDGQTQNDRAAYQEKVKLAEKELRRRLPNIFRPPDSKSSTIDP